MVRILSVVLLACSWNGAAAAQQPVQGPPWRLEFTGARREALRSGRPIVVYLRTQNSMSEQAERDELPSAELAPVYDAAVWLWMDRDESGSPADLAAERMILRYDLGATPPALLILHPSTLAVLDRPGRQARWLARSIREAAGKIKKPEASIKPLLAKMTKATKLMTDGAAAKARTELAALAKGKDPWEFAWEARERMQTLPDATPPSLAERLEDPVAETRALALEEWRRRSDADSAPVPRFVALLEDPDGAVRHRALQCLGKFAPKELVSRAARQLESPSVLFRTEFLNVCRDAGDPAPAALIRDKIAKLDFGKELAAGIEALGTCGDAGMLEALRPHAQRGSADVVTFAATEAIERIVARAGDPARVKAAQILIDAFPPAADPAHEAAVHNAPILAGNVNSALRAVTGESGPPMPAQWTAATREQHRSAWRNLLNPKR